MQMGVFGYFGGTENGTCMHCIYKYAFSDLKECSNKIFSKETHLKIQFYIEKHVSQLF